MTAVIIDFEAARRARRLPAPRCPSPRALAFLGALGTGDRILVRGQPATFLDVQCRRRSDGGVDWRCLVLCTGTMVVCPPSDLEPA